ncbi:hypothetical protein [Paraburkholderia strydomiana]|uniref:hypothetical protein n=1 Tax=Paraburkholderia strydomiana TaxID=1245417 RepID=UPI002860DF74|nr:hypothetical protein [Paraburkholderia strydomiana]MDR7006167.1 hypothetical protein [Paraburkholderia strydomiana]
MNEQDKAPEPGHSSLNLAELFGGGFDLRCANLIQGGSFPAVVRRSISSLLLLAVGEDGRDVFTAAPIITPPVTVSRHNERPSSLRWRMQSKSCADLRLTKGETVLRRLLRVTNSPSLEVADMLRPSRCFARA